MASSHRKCRDRFSIEVNEGEIIFLLVCFRYCSTLQTVSEHIHLEYTDDGVSISMVKTHFDCLLLRHEKSGHLFSERFCSPSVGGGGEGRSNIPQFCRITLAY